ncbi:MAG: SIMPL domain-containing protein, partial [Flavobacterium sp.]
IEQYQTESRKKAILDAKQKAVDYASVLNQKVGKAILISDNSQTNYPQPMYRSAMMKADSAGEQKETLAIGEIEVISNVQVAFILE